MTVKISKQVAVALEILGEHFTVDDILKAYGTFVGEYAVLNTIPISKLADALINGFEIESKVKYKDLPETFKFTSKSEDNEIEYVALKVKDGIVISWFSPSLLEVKSMFYSETLAQSYLVTKFWTLKGDN